MNLRDARSLPAIAQEDLRQKAIKAVLDGKKQVEVAKILGVTRQAVGEWVKTYREEGSRALKAQKMIEAIFAVANANLILSDNTSMANMFSMPQRKMQTI